MKNKFIDILRWAYNQSEGFTIDQLYKEFNNLDKDWFLKVFRGGMIDDDCLIGILKYDDKRNTHYYHLTAKGLSEYLRNNKKWWERMWVQILFIIGAIAGIISLYSLFK